MVTNRIFPRKKTYFLHTCATCSEIPFNMYTMIMSFMLQCNHACKFARVPKKLFAYCEINNVYVAEGLQGGTKKYAFFFMAGRHPWQCMMSQFFRRTVCPRRYAHFCTGNHYLLLDKIFWTYISCWKCFLSIEIKYKNIMNFCMIFLLSFYASFSYFFSLSSFYFSVCLFMPISSFLMLLSLFCHFLSFFLSLTSEWISYVT